MISISYKIYLRENVTRKDGTKPIYLRVTILRKSKEFSLKLSSFPNNWDKGNLIFIGKDRVTNENNIILQSYKNKINELILKYKYENKQVYLSDFENDFLGKKIYTIDFCEFIDQTIEANKHKFAVGTLKFYKGNRSKLNRFNPKLKFTDINISFIKKYEKYMITVLNNNVNTCNKSLTFIKSILNKAIQENIIDENPFKNFPIKNVDGKRDFLTKDEVQKIKEFTVNTDNTKLKNVAQYFLFSCLSGLRYSDIKALKYKDIVNDIISIKMVKTKDYVRIPLNNITKGLLDDYVSENEFVFKVYSNQKTNDYLKEIAIKTGIKKLLTFHVARHTFATLGLNVGIPIEVISKMLGHANIKTTQIYAKIVDDLKIQEMKKFNFMD